MKSVNDMNSYFAKRYAENRDSAHNLFLSRHLNSSGQFLKSYSFYVLNSYFLLDTIGLFFHSNQQLFYLGNFLINIRVSHRYKKNLKPIT